MRLAVTGLRGAPVGAPSSHAIDARHAGVSNPAFETLGYGETRINEV
jgi:hypothetical protein